MRFKPILTTTLVTTLSILSACKTPLKPIKMTVIGGAPNTAPITYNDNRTIIYSDGRVEKMHKAYIFNHATQQFE